MAEADPNFNAAVDAAVEARVAAAVAAALAATAPAALPAAAPAQPPADAATVSAVKVTLPTFWTSDPDMWFFQANLVFEQHRITRSATKYGHAMAKIPVEVLSSIKSTINSLTAATPDPYEQLCAALSKAHGMSRWQRGFALLNHPELGDRRPSRMMSEMLALLPAGTEPDLLFYCLYLARLPASIRDHVAAGDHKTADVMAAHADLLWDARAGNATVAAVTDSLAAVSLRHRSLSPKEGRRRSNERRSPDRRSYNNRRRSRSRNNTRRRDEEDPDLCFYHNRWGKKAEKCESPCAWTKN